MGSSPKIMVFKLREIIYTVILLFLVILLAVCLVLMFSKKSAENGSGLQTQWRSDAGTQQSLTGESTSETQNHTGTSNTQSNKETSNAQSNAGTSSSQSNTGTSSSQSNTDTSGSQSNTGTSSSQSNAGTSNSQTGSGADAAETASVEAAEEAEQTASPAGGAYVAGVYTSSITLGDSAVDVEVTVNSNRIEAIRLVNLSEATAAAYPLVSSSLDNIAAQILEKQKLDGITCSSENRYTSQLLLNAVSDALALAKNAG